MGDVLENSGALMNEERALDSRSEYDWVKDRLLFFETAEAGQDFGSKTMRKTFYLSSSCAAHPPQLPRQGSPQALNPPDNSWSHARPATTRLHRVRDCR